MKNAGQLGGGGTVCRVRIDRIQFSARTLVVALLLAAGFERLKDQFVRSRTRIKTYNRVTVYRGRRTNTQLFIQSDRACPWLSPLRVTVVGDDQAGLQGNELNCICGTLNRVFTRTRVLLVEVAFDFEPGSGIDRTFVLRHVLFGKSRPVIGRLFGSLRYGRRHSATLVRAYHKTQLDAYRIEIEFHSSWLRGHGIKYAENISELAALVVPDRIAFADLDWEHLRSHLLRKTLPADQIIVEAQSRAQSLHRALAYLRRTVGLKNVHRFLRPLAINQALREALQQWASEWKEANDERR